MLVIVLVTQPVIELVVRVVWMVTSRGLMSEGRVYNVCIGFLDLLTSTDATTRNTRGVIGLEGLLKWLAEHFFISDGG